MKKLINSIISFLIFFIGFSQKELDSDQFYADQTPMEIKLNYSNKSMKKNTNDSIYVKTDLAYNYQNEWKSIPVELRARGNFRRAKCYFPPIKMKIKKSNYKNTIFDGNKKMKLVLPCRTDDEKNDNILKEYLAYKVYELVSPYHFKTRRVNIEFTEPKGKKEKKYSLKGFLIEDDSKLEKRFGGRVVEQFVHPLAMDGAGSVQHAIFQYMIGNTDFSVAYQHNGKLLYNAEKKFIPLPYDFDMTGWVDPSYGFGNPTLNLSSLTERQYRGFKRDTELMNEIRDQFLTKKEQIISIVNSMKSEFDNESAFDEMNKFMMSFFSIIEDDNKFNKEIVAQARTK